MSKREKALWAAGIAASIISAIVAVTRFFLGR